jgi:hypothetical protein
MSKEQLLQELAEAFERLIGTATEAAQRGVSRQGDRWGPRQIVAHLAGWEVMATVRIPKIAAGMPPLEEANQARQAHYSRTSSSQLFKVNGSTCLHLASSTCRDVTSLDRQRLHGSQPHVPHRGSPYFFGKNIR